MNLKLYDETDIQEKPEQQSESGEAFRFSFVRDLPGDNPDVLGDYNNVELARKLQELGAFGPDDQLDPEVGCFYAYFNTRKDAWEFIRKLNAYVGQKARLLQEAKAY